MKIDSDFYNKVYELYKKHGLYDDWTFELDNALQRFGCCNWRKKRITMSKALIELNTWERVKQTLLHEIAHALTPGHHHDKVWRAKAKELGHTGNRCYSLANTNTQGYRYMQYCKICDIVCGRKLRMSYSFSSCGNCCKEYNTKFVLFWKINPDFKGKVLDYHIKNMDEQNKRIWQVFNGETPPSKYTPKEIAMRIESDIDEYCNGIFLDLEDWEWNKPQIILKELRWRLSHEEQLLAGYMSDKENEKSSIEYTQNLIDNINKVINKWSGK